MSKKTLQYAVSLALLGAAQCASATSFYFAAHADDIELFMARNAAYDVASNAKVVFVVTTTGSFVRGEDGSVNARGNAPFPGHSAPYYLAREAGHTAALATWFKQQNKTVRTNSVSQVTIAGKTVQRTEIGGAGSNVIMYNLRLTDGDDQAQSGLTWFRNQSITSPLTRISAVDGTASYTWTELKSFVNGLISREQNTADTWVNLLEYWEDGVNEVNYDHQDHKTTGRLVSHALADYAAQSPTRCIRSLQWVGYATQTRPANYTSAEASLQSKVWTDYNVAQVNADGPNTNDSGHAVWLHRTYTSANGVNGVTNFGPCG